MTKTLVPVRSSTTITRGTTTNRVGPVRRSKSAGSAKRAYRQDPDVRGLDTAVTCICMPVAELISLDAACNRTQMARSHFIRQAVKHFIEKVRVK